MYNPLRLILPLALLSLAARLVGAGPSAPPETAAIVCAVQGGATLRAAADAPPEPLVPCRRLAPGAVVETAAKSTVTIVFFDGQRLVLQPQARAVVGPAKLQVERGQVRRLASVRVIVDLAPLLRDDAHRRRTPAVRIRGNGGSEAVVSGLEPRDRRPALRSATTLSFDPVQQVEVYHVEVAGADGQVAFAKDVRSPRVVLPKDLLRPGASYYWWVEPKVPPHREMRGDAVFRTLDEHEESARTALVARRTEPDLAELLAEVDRALGMEPERQP